MSLRLANLSILEFLGILHCEALVGFVVPFVLAILAILEFLGILHCDAFVALSGCALSGPIFIRGDNILLDRRRCKGPLEEIKSPIISRYYEIFFQKNTVTYRHPAPPTKFEITLEGLDFVFLEVEDEGRFILTKRAYHPLELIVLIKKFLDNLNRVNHKGYTRMEDLEGTFMDQIRLHLYELGYKDKVLGNDENSYTV